MPGDTIVKSNVVQQQLITVRPTHVTVVYERPRFVIDGVYLKDR